VKKMIKWGEIKTGEQMSEVLSEVDDLLVAITAWIIEEAHNIEHRRKVTQNLL
jgi:hypothetical protein